MAVRSFVLMVGGTFLSVAFTLLLASYQQNDQMAQVRVRHFADRVSQIVLMLDNATPEARPIISATLEKLGARVDWQHRSTVIGKPQDDEFTKALVTNLGESRNIRSYRQSGEECPSHPWRKEALDANRPNTCRTVFVNLRDGIQVRLDVAVPPDRPPPPFRPEFLPYLFVFVACLGLLAFFIAHMATRPLRQLAQSARDLGVNLTRPPLSEVVGSTEVRQAAAAFNQMKNKIQHHLLERTHMLAAIAHDLQTPLTRLRLRLEKVADAELREKLVNDLSATQSMVKEGLELARSQTDQAKTELLDLDALVESVCNDAIDAGMEVTVSSESGISLYGNVHGLRRCLSNLIDNAVKYGNFAHVSVKKSGKIAIISVIDGGAGVDPENLEAVFRPFYRVESSRSRETGGTGLGLTIARNIAEQHGGGLVLRNIQSGELGLEAILTLKIDRKPT